MPRRWTDIDAIDDSALLALAVRIGKARLIDNRVLERSRRMARWRKRTAGKTRRAGARTCSAIFSPGCWSFCRWRLRSGFIGWVIGLFDSVLDVLPDPCPSQYLFAFCYSQARRRRYAVSDSFSRHAYDAASPRGGFSRPGKSSSSRSRFFAVSIPRCRNLVQTFLGQSSAQRQVVMIEYPRVGVYTVGFRHGPGVVASGR